MSREEKICVKKIGSIHVMSTLRTSERPRQCFESMLVKVALGTKFSNINKLFDSLFVRPRSMQVMVAFKKSEF